MPLLTIKENIFGGAIAPFTADAGTITGEGGGSDLPTPTNFTGLVNPAPAAVYESYKYDSAAQPITGTGFTPNSTVLLRYHIFSARDDNDFQLRIADNNSPNIIDFTYRGRAVGAAVSTAKPGIYEIILTADNNGSISATLSRTGGFTVWLVCGLEYIEQPAGGSTTTRIILASDLSENLHGVLDANAFSRFTFQTTETALTLGIYSTLFSTAAIVSNLMVKVNGAFHSLVSATAQGDGAVNVTLPAGLKTIEITNGIQNRPDTNPPLGTWLKSVTHNGTITPIAPTNSGKKILIFGDSISSGANVGNGENLEKGFLALLRNTRTESIALDGWGYRSLFAVSSGEMTAAAESLKADTFICALSVNDFVGELQSAADFGIQVGQLADALHAARPNMRIIFVTGTILGNEAANKFGDTFYAYRTATATALATRNWATLIVGKTMTTAANLVDGIHPNAAGHIDIANGYNTFLDETLVEICIGDSTMEGRKVAVPSSSLDAVPHLYRNLIGANSANSYKETFNGMVVPENQYLPTNGDFDANKKILVVNFGIGGQTITQAIAAFNTQVLSRNGNFTETWVNLVCIINETQFSDAAQIYQKLKDYATLCKNNNVKLRLATCAAATNTPLQTIAFAVNDLLRADYSFCNQFVDLHRNTAFTDATNSTYFETDGVHWKTALNQKAAEMFYGVRQKTISFPQITTANLPNATQGVAYSQVLGAINNPTLWVLKAGNLPNGAAFDPTSKTFTTTAATPAGSYPNLVVWAIDANGNYDEKIYTLNVVSPSAITDDFNRTDGVIGNGWQPIVSGGFSVPTGNIVSNQLVITGGNSFHGFVRPDLLVEGSSEIQLISASGNGLAPVVRLQTNGDCYFAYAALGSAAFTRIYKSSGGSYAPVSSVFPFALAVGDTLKLKPQGNVIIFSYIRGGVETEIGRYTDAANPILTAGKFGFVSDAATVILDNYNLINSDGGTSNTPPTMSKVDDFTINEDTPSPVFSVTVSDAEQSAASLQLSAVSNNPALIPNSANNIILGVSGANRTFQVVPAANQYGTASITLTLTDGTNFVTQTVLVTVNSVNDVPTISAITNQTTATTTPVVVNFSISDVETIAANLQVTATSSNQTLLPNANLVFFGTGANRSLTATAASGQTGFADITIAVFDGTATTTRVFRITVNPSGGGDNQNPTCSITSPADNATVSGNILINATAADNVGVAGVTFAIDGVDVATDNFAPYSYLLNTANLTDGIHSITATATDTSNLKTSVSIDIFVDNSTAPVSKIIQLDWDAPDPSVASAALPFAYRLMRSTSADFAQNPTTITLGNVLTHPDTVPANAAGFYYKIQSQNAGGWSVFSASIYVPLS